MAIIQLEHVGKRYAESTEWALSNVSLAVQTGEILILLGPSGCGKTTTLRLIAGFERPTTGTITINGRIVANGTLWVSPEKRGVGMVFQDFALFPHLTVEKNIAFGLYRWEESRRKERIEEILSLVGLQEFRNRYPYELSGGQQQRVALARALAPKPLVILMDEPFSNLDADMRSHVQQEVRQILRESKTTAILVTHDQEEAFDIADRVAVMRQGRIEQVDTPENIYHRPATKFVAEFVGHNPHFLPGEIKQGKALTEIGPFVPQAPLPEGSRVEVLIRPYDIEIIPHPSGEGKVLSRRFRGAENRYAILLPSGRQVCSSQPSGTVISSGTRVQVIPTTNRVAVFPQQE
ncbi:MAG: ABC transporter ATP-binding protein [Nitrospinota bacterium]|nr:MAG: ABC transporter ATP-binding protein [Nitrospinota bacterium]